MKKDYSYDVIGAAYTVHNLLGFGFLERVYHNALKVELESLGLHVESEKQIDVVYKEIEVGNYYADLVIQNNLIVEIKAIEKLNKWHEVQLVNYLKATSIELGLLINFGKSVEIKRKIFLNQNKN